MKACGKSWECSPLLTVPANACHPAVATAANNYGAGTVIWNGQGCAAGRVGRALHATREQSCRARDEFGDAESADCAAFLVDLSELLNSSLGAPNSGATGYSYPSSDLTHENFGPDAGGPELFGNGQRLCAVHD